MKAENKTMKRTLLTLIAACALVPSAFYAASTEKWAGLGDGMHGGQKTTDRVGFHDAAPSAQQAATMTAVAVLQAKGLMAAGQDYSIRHVTVSLSAAEMIAMYTTPKVLIAAPGAGKSIVVQKVAITTTRTATAFTGGGAAIVQYAATANGAGTQAGAAGTTVSFRNGAVVSDAASTVTQNVGLYVSNQTGVFAAGTGTATVDIWYYVY